MLPKGTIIDGKYEIENSIGIGGFGAVYRAAQKQLDRIVAIKMLNTTLLLEAEGLPRFEREAKAIDSLKHKNIVRLYGYGTWQQAPYMVMEFIDGTSVDHILKIDESIEPPRALRIIKQVFEGLACAHAAGVVHRDLKPSNIMITEDAEGKECVKLIDFGLAKLMPGYGIPGQKLTETGFAVGTCHYMAPEQALGGVVDGRSDIYSAGCILYQMLTGRPPYDSDNNVTIMHQHLNDQPISVAKLLPAQYPVAAIAALLENCMAKDASHRYQLCTDAIAHIDAILEGKFSKVTALSIRPMKSLHVQPSRNKFRGAALAVCAASIALLAFGAYSWNSEKEQDRLAKLQSERSFVQAAMVKPVPDFTAATTAKLESIKALDDAEHFLSKAERYFTLTHLGIAYTMDGTSKNQTAIQYADEAVRILPDAVIEGDHRVCDVATIYSKLGEKKRMLDVLNLAERSPDVAVRFSARIYLGQNALAEGKVDLAESYATKNLNEPRSINASTTIALMNMAVVKFFQRDLREAEKLNRIVSEGHDEEEAWSSRARCALFTGDSRQAVYMAEQAAEAYHRHSAGLYQPAEYLRAAALHYMGNEKEALSVESNLAQGPAVPGDSVFFSPIDQKILRLSRTKTPLKPSDITI
jgi:serine/threonine protein kinase